MRDGSSALPGWKFAPLAALVFLFSAAMPALAQPVNGGWMRAERQAEILIARDLEEERGRLAPDAPPAGG